MSDFLPTAYVKTNCPFSFKFRLFMTEAGLNANINYVELDPDASDYAVAKTQLRTAVGHGHTFPIVEIAPGKYLSDSDDLITHFANQFSIDAASMPTLQFYKTGLFPTFLEMFHVLATPMGWIARLGRRPKAFR